MERKIILFCCLLAGTDSAVFLALQNQIPGHPNQCYDRDQTAFYEKGDKMLNEYSDKTCGEKICLGKYEHGEEKVATEFRTCGVMDGPKIQLKTCNITAALGPYPDCCVPYENVPPPDLCGPAGQNKPDGRFASNKIRREIPERRSPF